jgi:glyoxylase-like metal-dependent hydrolase (beta-lactamase superfamily II)
MNPLEQQLNYVFFDAIPEPGHSLEVAPGIFWMRMPLPFVLDHVNVWVIRDEINGVKGWTIVDCGIADESIRANWERAFDQLIGGRPVLRVIVTHCHPDHIGLADWICQGGDRKRWKPARMWTSHGEYMMARVMAHDGASDAGGEQTAQHFARNGLADPESLEAVVKRRSYYSELVPSLPPQYRRIRNDDELEIGDRMWVVVAGFGHSPEHCALFSAEDNVLISGDMVLPRISTNVSVLDVEPEGNPLALFLASLGRYEDLPVETLVLPSHGKPFRGMHTRIEQLRNHHAARLQEVRDACAFEPKSAADIVPIMFARQLDVHQMTFALGEALAHLHMLWLQGELDRLTELPDGIIRFGLRQQARLCQGVLEDYVS